MGKYDPAPTLAAGLIRWARAKSDLTQRQLAERAGVSQQTISAYETGRMDPTVSTVERLIGAAGFELRIQLVRRAEHDESLENLLELLPAEERSRIEGSQRERVARARLDRVRGH